MGEVEWGKGGVATQLTIGSFLLLLQNRKKFARREDRRTLIVANCQELLVSCDEVIGIGADGSGEDEVVLGMGGNTVDVNCYWTHLGEVTQ
jgi:hypothetical protein